MEGDACALIEAGFDFVWDFNGNKLFRKKMKLPITITLRKPHAYFTIVVQGWDLNPQSGGDVTRISLFSSENG